MTARKAQCEFHRTLHMWAINSTAGRIVDSRPSDTVAIHSRPGCPQFIHIWPQGPRYSVQKPQSFFHLHLVSDATGETLLAAGRAAAAQYKDARAIEHIYPLIRTEKQLMKVFEEVEEEPGIILYTVVDQHLACLLYTSPSPRDS